MAPVNVETPVTLKVPVVVPPDTNMPSLVVSIFLELLNLNSELEPLLKIAKVALSAAFLRLIMFALRSKVPVAS